MTFTTAEALDGAAMALELASRDLAPDDAHGRAKAAIIAYLNLTGRDDEAAAVSRADEVPDAE